MKVILLIGFFLISVAITACGGSNAQDAPGDSSADAKQRSNLVAEVPGAPNPRRPKIPKGPPPKKVIIKDLKKGRGVMIQPGDGFAANYVSLEYGSGKEAETFWGDSAFQWVWRKNQLSKGWEIGLEGMRVGGHRELIVPSELAYDSGARAYFIELLRVGP